MAGRRPAAGTRIGAHAPSCARLLILAGQQIVGADNGMPLCQNRIAQMRSQKARPSSDQDAHGSPPSFTPAKSLSKAFVAFIESAPPRSTCVIQSRAALAGRTFRQLFSVFSYSSPNPSNVFPITSRHTCPSYNDAFHSYPLWLIARHMCSLSARALLGWPLPSNCLVAFSHAPACRRERRPRCSPSDGTQRWRHPLRHYYRKVR